ncbi:DNA gyrase inhibitor YacG [Roseovarius rhodophyticola]|uniref:DNA gyrase inhibitor YacG n=1 Tax=Roseovarius rhodophyticola TaxID=3080827 RepID=A0ABZ2TBR1_9RHOB|nr:DNA gyrase inhibitor YacG [Roseovarius sp. W115]MDV2930842.1 DNA gyrase inhibitor YacG [Roseovarius sp. W115]
MSCPICGKDTVQAVRPFCSKRCADVDLANWMRGKYVVASDDADEADEVELRLPDFTKRPMN